MALHITRHALERALERVPGITSEEEARAILNTNLIARTADFAGHAECHVRLGTGQRVALAGQCIITVLPAAPKRRCKKGKHP